MGFPRTRGHRATNPSLRRATAALALAAVCLEPTFLAAQAYAVVSHPSTRSTRPPDRRAHPAAITPWEAAERTRDAFEATVESTRTRAEYTRVMDRFRAIYHDNPRDPHAPEAINAVAELLAESGRDLHDRRSFEAAVAQYEFLRTQYPGSSLRTGALLAEGQIAENDLRDPALAREKYQLLLKSYPKSALAEQAQAGLASLSNRQHAGTPLAATANPVSRDPRAAPLHSLHSDQASGQTAANQTAAASQIAQPAAPIVRSPRAADRNPQLATSPAQPSSPRAESGSLASAVARGGGEPRSVEAPASSTSADQGATALPPPRQVAHRAGPLPTVSGIRHWSTASYTRVAIDLGDQVEYEAARVPSPDRIFFDLHGARLAPDLVGKSFAVTDDGFLKRIRVSQSAPDVARIVLDVNDVTEYSAFLLPNPYRLIIDIHGKPKAAPAQQLATVDAPAPRTTAVPNTHAMHAGSPTDVNNLGNQPGRVDATSTPTSQPIAATVAGRDRSAELTQPRSTDAASTLPASQPSNTQTTTLSSRAIPERASRNAAESPASSATTPTLSCRPEQRGVEEPALSLSKGPASSATTKTTPADARIVGDPNPAATARAVAAAKKAGRKGSKSTIAAADTHPVADPATPARAAALKTADGQTSLVRALGLKINRIVIDAGHGGHDSGTLGVDGIQEKDVVLDVALRLGALLHDKLGAEVIYTRSDDTFIPLETRTAIANKAQADLFLSIHANSSPDSSARGVETYYLNFTQQADALEVAARENAVSGQSVSQLSDLVRKITLKDKIAESREFATDVEASLYAGLAHAPENLRVSIDSGGKIKDRGVKKAPFVVLIGANMPSILAEISFVTNPRDATLLRQPDYKQRVAESLYKGVARYVGSLSSTAPATPQTERAATSGQ